MVFLLACSGSAPITQPEVPGVYRWNQADVDDAIVIDPNGTYEHVVKRPTGEITREHGTWQFDRDPGYLAVELYNFRFLTPRFGGDTAKRGAIFPAPIDRSGDGRLRLSINEDVNLYYVK